MSLKQENKVSNKETRLYDPRILGKCGNKCPLMTKQNEAEFVYFEYHGELKDIKTIFVGGSPGKIDAEFKRPFYSATLSGMILRKIPIALNLESYAFVNVTSCWSNNRIPTQKENNYCSVHLNLFLNNIAKKSVVFLLGKTAIAALLSKITGYVDECRTVESMVKLKPITYRDRLFVPAYHPHYIGSRGGIKSREYQEYLERFRENIK